MELDRAANPDLKPPLVHKGRRPDSGMAAGMISTLLQWRSLKTRVTAFTLAIFLVSVWGLTFYAGQILRDDLQRLLSTQQYSTASVMAAAINQHLDERMKALEKVVERVTPAMLGSADALQGFLQERPLLLGLFNGGVIAYRADGAVIAGSLPQADRIGVNFMNIDTVGDALRHGKPNIGTPVMDKTLGAPGFGITVPIRDAHGKVIGALAGVTNLGLPNFLDEIASYPYGKAGSYLVVSRQLRQIIAASDKNRVMEAAPAPGAIPLIDRFIGGYEGSGIMVNPLGVEVLQSAKGIPLAGWYVAVQLPVTDLFAPVAGMQRQLLLAALALTLLSGGLTWWMLRRQLAPMLTAAQALARREHDEQGMQPLPVVRQDEIGMLVGSFNQLLEKLAKRDAVLRKHDELLHGILDASIDGFWCVDDQGRLLDVNPTYCQQSGYDRDELLRMRISDVEAEEDPAAIEAHIRRIIKTGHDLFQTRHRRKDGSLWHVEVSTTYRAGVFSVFLRDITARKQEEDVLKASEQRFRDLVNTTDGIVWEADARTFQFTFISEKAVKLLGFPADDWLAPGFWVSRLHPEDASWAPEFCASCTGRLEPHDFNYRFIAQDGRTVWLHDIVTVVAEQGSPRWLRGIMVDVTLQKQTAAALQESEARWQFAIEGAGDGLWDWDVPQGKGFFSTACKEMLGFAPDEIGNDLDEWSKHVHPDDMVRVMADVQAHLAGTTPRYRNEHRVSCKDGSYKWILARGLVITRDAAGNPLRMIGTHTDITERKLLEMELQESENTFKKILEASSDAVLLQDSTAAFVDCNQAALDLLKMTREQFIRMTPDQISVEFQPNGRRSEEYAPEMTALGWKGFHRFDWTCRNGEGGEFIVEVSLMPIILKGQSMLYCTWRDITERKRSEEAVRQLAFYDPLTGLPNRRLLADRLIQTLAATRRSGCYSALILLDLDNFKPLNDAHGHDAGDLLLIEVANRLKNSVREMDTVVRLGGDEFVVIVNELEGNKAESIAHARGIAEKLRLALAAPYRLALHRDGAVAELIEHHCTATLGCALLNHETNAEDVMRWADAAMYRAKSAGRNRVRFHEAQDD